jgi:hypothetical protein
MSRARNRRLPRLRALTALGVACVWAVACGGPQSLGGAGSVCFRADECQPGLACIPETLGSAKHICSADLSGIVSMVDGAAPDSGDMPDETGGGSGAAQAGAPATAGAPPSGGAAGRPGTGGAPGAAGASPTAGAPSGGSASAGAPAGGAPAGGAPTGGAPAAGGRRSRQWRRVRGYRRLATTRAPVSTSTGPGSLLPEKLPGIVLQVSQHLLQIVVQRFIHDQGAHGAFARLHARDQRLRVGGDGFGLSAGVV